MTSASLKLKIAISFWRRNASDDVVNQLELENSAGFDGSSGQAEIRFGMAGWPLG
jgi:hypothetical protein